MAARILFAAGGTGGHIFPALAVADACREIDPEAAIAFVGTRGRLEERVVPRAGYPLHFVWISGLQGLLSLSTLLLPLKIVVACMQSIRLLRRFRPDVVVCAGAYVSYPVGRMAALLGIPLVLMESNALPGKVVRALASRAVEVHVAFDEARKHLASSSVVTSGNPVRGALYEPRDPGDARAHFGLGRSRPTLFVTGGSLGARSINAALDVIVAQLIADGVQVIWQTGRSYTGGECRDAMLYRATFIHEMELCYVAADLVVARAGATTIAELAAVGKPAILVPLPTAADDHQRVNAEAMQAAGAGVMVLDADQATTLLPTIRALMADDERLAQMSHAVARFGIADAAQRIAGSVVGIARRKRT